MASVSSLRIAGPVLLPNPAANAGSAVPANEVWKDLEFHFTNNDTTSRAVDVYLIPTSGSAGDGTHFLRGTGNAAFILGPGETAAWSTEQVMVPGDQLKWGSDVTDKVMAMVSGKKQTQG